MHLLREHVHERHDANAQRADLHWTQVCTHLGNDRAPDAHDPPISSAEARALIGRNRTSTVAHHNHQVDRFERDRAVRIDQSTQGIARVFRRGHRIVHADFDTRSDSVIQIDQDLSSVLEVTGHVC